MDFITFLIVNCILYLRPPELLQELDRLPLYYFAMLACLASSFLYLIQFFFYSPLIKHPTVILCYLMLFFAGASLLVNQDLGTALDEEIEFVKVLTYFTLFLAIVRTPARLQGIITCVVACMTVTAILAILHYYEVIKIAILEIQATLIENQATWSEESLRRLRFTGILHDPNEVAVFLSMLSFLCAFQLTDRSKGMVRYLWLVPMAVFAYAIILTYSRGGMLSLLVGLVVFAIYHFRSKKSLFFLGFSVPLILIAVGGRQTEISANASTAQTRIGLWSDWMQEFRSSPIVGVGPNIASLVDAQSGNNKSVTWEGTKHCAHNSYLQPFADLGFLGGLCFLGAVGFGLITVHRYGFDKTTIVWPELARLQPYLMAALACYAMGFLTLTLTYVIPTFFVLALPVAYYGMTPCIPQIRRPTLTAETWARLSVAGIGFLAFTYAMVRVMPKG